MLCCLPVCKNDLREMDRLLCFMQEQGGCKSHHALLVADAGADIRQGSRLSLLAKHCFASATVISNKTPVSGWPLGPNSLFFTAAEYIQGTIKQPFIWVESDCVPLQKGWLDSIEAGYKACKKQFFGPLTSTKDPPDFTYMAGVSVYPPKAFELMRLFRDDVRAWDIATREMVVPMAAHTNLIQHCWGRAGLPPTFSATYHPGDPAHIFTVSKLHKDAVLFHRNKDGTLIRLLRDGLGLKRQEPAFVVILTFFPKDAALMLKALRHMLRLNTEKRFPCILSYDAAIDIDTLRTLYKEAMRCFSTVDVFNYGTPPKPGWPSGANYAFQTTAKHMAAAIERPWLWIEADAVPLKWDWLEQLSEEYVLGKKPMMGSIVPRMGHMNGVGVYPANFPDVSSIAMRATDKAWDYLMKPQTEKVTHDASKLIQHFWGLVNGEKHHCSGDAPHFINLRDVQRWVDQTAVLFHRCKDGSLIDVLEGENNGPEKFNRIPFVSKPDLMAAEVH